MSIMFNGGGGVIGMPDPFAGFQNAQNQYNQNQNYFGNQAATLAAADVPQHQLYGGGSFGAQPAHFAGVGAAYGRGTGGFNAVGGVTQQVGSRGRGGGSSVFDTGTTGIPYLEGGGSPYGGGGFGRGSNSVFDTGTSGIPNLGGGGMPFGGGGFGRGRDMIAEAMMQQPSGGFQMPKSEPAGGQSFIEPDLASRTSQMKMPNSQQLLGYNPETSGTFAPGGGNQFASRFGFPNAGMPSEYTTSPYEDAQGRVHQPSQMPAGFQTPFSAENPGGALGRGGFRGSQAPMMNSSEGEDTLTAQDANIPYNGPSFGGAGSFDPSAFNSSQFAQGSPFGSGRGARAGVGTVGATTSLPFFGGEGSGFGTPGSTQNGGQFAGRGRLPALIGASQDTYGNPFIHGNAQPFAQGAGRMGGGAGLGGLDLLGQGTVFRGRG